MVRKSFHGSTSSHVPLQASLAAANNASGNGGPKKRLGDAVGWFKGLGAAATNMVGSGGSRAADAAEDPEYIKVRHRLHCRHCRASGSCAPWDTALAMCGFWQDTLLQSTASTQFAMPRANCMLNMAEESVAVHTRHDMA